MVSTYRNLVPCNALAIKSKPLASSRYDLNQARLCSASTAIHLLASLFNPRRKTNPDRLYALLRDAHGKQAILGAMLKKDERKTLKQTRTSLAPGAPGALGSADLHVITCIRLL